MTYSWLAVEARTGVVIADLPGLDCDKVSTQIGAYTTTTAALPVATRQTPENWQRATKPGATFLVLVDDRADRPVWGGLVTKRTRTAGSEVELSLASPEAYLDRRYVGDELFRGVDQNVIVSTLVEKYVGRGSNGGIPVRVQVEGGAGDRIDREYADRSDKTVYSILTELMATEGGPEWTIEWEWVGSRLGTIFRVGTRLGFVTPEGLAPNATFEIPGPVSEVELEEDYTASGGATDVLATSSASGDERPQSDHIVTGDPDRPTFETRFAPSTSITDRSTLNSHARARAVAVVDGLRALSLASVTRHAPSVGVEWRAGDELGYVVGGLDRFGRDLVPAFPGGLTGIARSVGWELSFATDKSPEIITPVLQDPEEV